MNVIAKISGYFEHSVVTLKLSPGNLFSSIFLHAKSPTSREAK